MHETRLLHFFSIPPSNHWHLTAPASKGIPVAAGTAIAAPDLVNLTYGAWLYENGLVAAVTEAVGEGGVMSGWKVHSVGESYYTDGEVIRDRFGNNKTTEGTRDAIVVVVKEIDELAVKGNEKGIGSTNSSNSKEGAAGLAKGSGNHHKATSIDAMGDRETIDDSPDITINGTPVRGWKASGKAAETPKWGSGNDYDGPWDWPDDSSCGIRFKRTAVGNKKEDMGKRTDNTACYRCPKDKDYNEPCRCPKWGDSTTEQDRGNKNDQKQGMDTESIDDAHYGPRTARKRPVYTPESSAEQGGGWMNTDGRYSFRF
ncbi:MAG: hypothetical protein Q9222_003088 [Ikaeria aurantiellina]